MTIQLERQRDAIAVARRTLGWSADDKRSVPMDYLAALYKLLDKYPRQTNFCVDLEEFGGVITCLVCMQDVHVGREVKPSVYQFKDLRLWEIHVCSSAHKQNEVASAREAGHASSKLTPRHSVGGSSRYKRSRGASGSGYTLSRVATASKNARAPSFVKVEPPHSSDVETLSSDIESEEEQVSSPDRPHSVVEILSSPEDRKGKNKKRKEEFKFPDGEIITIESSDEDEDVGNVTISQSNMLSSTRPNGALGGFGTPRPGGSFATPLAGPMQKMGSQLSWTEYRTPPRVASYGSIQSAGPSSRKRSIEYPDGEILLISDEEGGDTDSSRYMKKARYDTEPEEPEESEVETEGTTDMEGGEDEDMPHWNAVDRSVALPGHFRLSAEADNAHGDGYIQQIGTMARNALGALGDAMQPYASGSNATYPDLGFHAPPMVGGMPVASTSTIQRHTRPFNINYDTESPVTWIDQGGADHAQQLQRFFDETMDDHEGAIPVRDAVKALGLKNATDRLPGMDVTLMPHQLIGVSWMVKQELGRVQGGILADDMGLGKTMQTIALITKNQPEVKNERKSTLIVAPAALLDQWRQEIVDRTEEGLYSIRIHHGKEKLRSAAEVKKYDIVITTFQTLTNEFPADDEELKKRAKQKKKKAKDKFIVDSSEEEREKGSRKNGGRGPLAATKWYRVVLDEAQNIRNRATRSSRMMALLDSEYRWALTGTPVTNTLADLYGLVRFLHFAPFNDWKEFNERIARIQKSNPKLAGQRAQALLKKCLLRRTKQSKLDGKPLITLQPKTIDIEELEFSPDERQVYAAVEARQQQTLNKFIRAGTVMKNYSVVLVMLLRLRQVCNHPKLIAYAAGEFIADGAHVVGVDGESPGSPASSGSKAMAQQLMSTGSFDMVMRQFRENAEAMCEAEVTGGEIPSNDVTECSICFEPYTGDARVTSCGHIYCAECLTNMFNAPLQGEAAANDQFGGQFAGTEVRPCPKCRNELTSTHIFMASIFEPSAEEMDEIKRKVDKRYGRVAAQPKYKTMQVDEDEEEDFVFKSKGKGKGKARARVESDDDEDFEAGAGAGAKGEGEELVPGAKMVKMAELLHTWHKEAPEDKIIAYSQWTSMIDLMQILLRRDGIESLRYDGQMNRNERDETLSRFKRSGGPKILLISLKCGGVGLNLTEANRVICMDLAWNAATENQAIDRVHRMGQVKSVFVKRLIIKNTIEERILKLQADKQNMSDAALGEGSGAKMPRMNVAQLKMLFGMGGR